jgi:hypothetical protein
MNWLNRLVAGCDCNRSTLTSIEAAGFDVLRVEHATLPAAPAFRSPLIIGTATATSGRQYPAGALAPKQHNHT